VISLEEARALISETLSGERLGREFIPVKNARRRVLATDVVSGLDMPPFDRVTVDGFAVADGESNNRLQIVGEVRAGQVWDEPVQPGSAVKIMTGAPAPPGTGRVVMVEQTLEKDGFVEIETEALSVGRHNIAPKGEDRHAGDVIARAGERLDAAHIAGLVSCGVIEVQVGRQPQVVVMATGDELVEDPEQRQGGQILNSNSPLLGNVLRSYDYPVEIHPVVPDDPHVTLDRISNALWKADVVVLTGGVSAGEYDFVPRALQEMELETLFTRVAIKPGKPTTLAVGDRGVVFGLPGNPVSAYITCHLFVLPALALLEGGACKERTLHLPLADDYSSRSSPRVQFLPARLTEIGEVVPLRYHGSGHQLALTAADGLFRLEPEVTVLAAGTRVPFWPVRIPAFTALTERTQGGR